MFLRVRDVFPYSRAVKKRRHGSTNNAKAHIGKIYIDRKVLTLNKRFILDPEPGPAEPETFETGIVYRKMPSELEPKE
jgi:hypothetical protein